MGLDQFKDLHNFPHLVDNPFSLQADHDVDFLVIPSFNGAGPELLEVVVAGNLLSVKDVDSYSG